MRKLIRGQRANNSKNKNNGGCNSSTIGRLGIGLLLFIIVGYRVTERFQQELWKQISLTATTNQSSTTTNTTAQAPPTTPTTTTSTSSSPEQEQQQLEQASSGGIGIGNGGGCAQNPYQNSLTVTLPEVSNKLESWLKEGYSADLKEATRTETLRQHTRERFKFFHDTMGQCAEAQQTCVGGACPEDEAKVVCGLEQLQNNNNKPEGSSSGDCIVYSIGGNNQWLFELDILTKTPCQVHTFDCTGDISRFEKPPNDRLHFHHVCLGTQHEAKATVCKSGHKCGETWTLLEMQQNLGHDRIDLFKMDIEGFEWDIFDSWPELTDNTQADQVLLPHQLLVEFHYWTQFPELRPPGTPVAYDFKTPVDFVKMAGHLAKMGYAVVHKKDGLVKHCAELTIMRVQCPSTGVYHHAA